MASSLARLRSILHYQMATAGNNTNQYLLPGSFSLSCNDAIRQDWDARFRLIVFSIFLVTYVVILVQWLLVRGRSAKAKEILYGSFGTATLLMIIYLSLAIACEVLYNCAKLESIGYIRFSVAVNVMQALANFLLMLIMLLPLTLTLLRHNCFKTVIPKIANSIYLGLLSIFCIFSVATASSNTVNVLLYGEDADDTLAVPVTATFSAMYLAGALVAMGYMLVTLRTMLKYPTEFNGHLKFTMPALSISILVFALVGFIEVFGWDVAHNAWTRETQMVFLVLNLFSQFTTYELILIVAGDKSFVDDDDLTGRGELMDDTWRPSMAETRHSEAQP